MFFVKKKEKLFLGGEINLSELDADVQKKYEVAKELGIYDKVLEKGWGSLTAEETGRVGGVLRKRKKMCIRDRLQAGQIKQLATIHMHDRGLRTAGWTSANPSIVSIDNNGYMKAKRSGKTYISTRINGRKRAFRVKVSGYTITYKLSLIHICIMQNHISWQMYRQTALFQDLRLVLQLSV